MRFPFYNTALTLYITGYCGSCWAFSAVEQIESDAIRTLGMSTSNYLSTQQVTSCATTSYGCSGGWTESAFDYAKSGLETDAVYPYTSGSAGVTGTCASSTSKMVIRLTGYTKVTGESAMASYVLGTGPLSICVAASTWSSYTGGIMSSCGTSINHCVQAVGLNMSASTQYWIVSIF
jgi:C1A family cysteine protease